MNESNKSNTVSDNSINKLLEKKGEQQVAQLLASNKSNEEMQTALLNIMKEGEKEFIKANNRKMTYSEMRSIYG
jgi:transcriptional regulatory protein LevR